MGSRAFIIDGKQHAKGLEDRIREAASQLLSHHGVQPGLAIIRIGSDPASALYVSSKGQQAATVGFHFEEHAFPDDVSEGDVLECIASLNANSSIHGIIIQLPLPAHLDKFRLLAAVDPSKDVDGLHPMNLGKLWHGDESGFTACTPKGCMALIHSVHPSITGKDVLMVGCSSLVGRPMAALLLNADATVSMAHSFTKNLPELCKRAEILVVAIGDPQFIQGDWIQPGATVIDVGINRLDDGRVVGDVGFDAASQVAGAITPVPGGVGPMTVASLLENTLIAAERSIIVT